MTEELEKYVLSHSAPEGDYLYRLYRATNIHTIHGRMASGHLQGRLLKMFVEMIRPKNILEVGTFSGYSAICMAEGLAEIAKSTEAHANGASVASAAEGDDKEAGVSKVWTFEINEEMCIRDRSCNRSRLRPRPTNAGHTPLQRPCGAGR